MKYTYNLALERMYELVERDHGGCDDSECSLRQALDDRYTSVEDVIWLWNASGAADAEFNQLYKKYEKKIRQKIMEDL